MQSLQHPNTRCLAKACDALGVTYAIRDDIGNWITVYIGTKEFHFIRSKTPFNNASIDALFRDKSFTYTLLHEEIAMPKTKQYLNPHVATQWQPLVSHQTTVSIADAIVETFGTSVVVKRNSGSHGNHVFVTENHGGIVMALNAIFDQTSTQYDPIALAQEVVEIVHEYRVLWFRGRVMLIYEKVTPQGKPHSQSPFVNPGAYAVVLSEQDDVYAQIHAFLSASKTIQAFEWCGFDVAADASGKYWLLEVNAWPSTEHVTKHVGDAPLVDVWKRVLVELQHE